MIRQEFLKNLPLFSKFKLRSIQYISQIADEKVLQPFEPIICQHETIRYLYILRTGKLMLTKMVENQFLQQKSVKSIFNNHREYNPEVTLIQLLPEDMIGATSRTRYPYKLTNGKDPSTLLVIPINLLREFIDPAELNRLDLFFKSKIAFYDRLLSKNVFYRNIHKFCEKKENEVEHKENDNLLVNFEKFYLKNHGENKKGNFLIRSKHFSTNQLLEQTENTRVLQNLEFSQPQGKTQKLPRVNIKIIRKSIDKLQRFIKSKSEGPSQFLNLSLLNKVK